MLVSRIKKESLFFCLSMREELQIKSKFAFVLCVFQKRREDTCKKEGLFCGDYDDDGKRGGGGGGGEDQEEEEKSEAMGDVLERGVDDGRGVLRRGLLR